MTGPCSPSADPDRMDWCATHEMPWPAMWLHCDPGSVVKIPASALAVVPAHALASTPMPARVARALAEDGAA